MKQNMSEKKGFTLIELVIVIAILSILALILVPTINKYTVEANKAKDQASLRTLYTEALLLNSQFDFSKNPRERESFIMQTFSDKGIKGVIVKVTEQNSIGSIEYTSDNGTFNFNGRIMREVD